MFHRVSVANRVTLAETSWLLPEASVYSSSSEYHRHSLLEEYADFFVVSPPQGIELPHCVDSNEAIPSEAMSESALVCFHGVNAREGRRCTTDTAARTTHEAPRNPSMFRATVLKRQDEKSQLPCTGCTCTYLYIQTAMHGCVQSFRSKSSVKATSPVV